MKIANSNSINFTGCIATTSKMDGVQKEVVYNFNRFLHSNPNIIELTDNLGVDIVLMRSSKKYKDSIHAVFLDRTTTKLFDKVIYLYSQNNPTIEKQFFHKIVDFLNQIADGEVKRPEYNEKATNRRRYGVANQDDTLWSLIKNSDQKNKQEDLAKIYKDYFEKVDEVDFIYEI